MIDCLLLCCFEARYFYRKKRSCVVCSVFKEIKKPLAQILEDNGQKTKNDKTVPLKKSTVHYDTYSTVQYSTVNDLLYVQFKLTVVNGRYLSQNVEHLTYEQTNKKNDHHQPRQYNEAIPSSAQVAQRFSPSFSHHHGATYPFGYSKKNKYTNL